jgi:release factor glutamine methyltransferase
MRVTITKALREAGRSIGEIDARALLGSVLGCDVAYLIAHGDEALGTDPTRTFDALAARRRAGEPVAYLTGEREFFSLSIKVSPAVLIPRPETELLVELALERLARDRRIRVLDLGTGSGCISVALACERPAAEIVAVDIAAEAVELAAENAERHGARNVRAVSGDWFAATAGSRFDMIVSNPPYIAEGDPHLVAGDVRFEPRAALVAGADGLACITAIVAGARARLEPGGWLLFEHGYDQGARCRALLNESGFAGVRSWPDFAGIERVSGGRCAAIRRDAPVAA